MPRPKDQSHVLNPVFSYIQFLEMAGYVSSYSLVICSLVMFSLVICSALQLTVLIRGYLSIC